MESFEQKALDAFSEIVINKAFVHNAGFGSRAIPDLCAANGSSLITWITAPS